VFYSRIGGIVEERGMNGIPKQGLSALGVKWRN
jgi:hypothetical protein